MPKCLFDRASGLFVASAAWDDLPHDDAVQVQISLTFTPDPRTQRWDGGAGVRPATLQEQGQYDTQQKNADASGQADMKIFKALVVVLANHFGITPQQLRTELLNAFQALP